MGTGCTTVDLSPILDNGFHMAHIEKVHIDAVDDDGAVEGFDARAWRL